MTDPVQYWWCLDHAAVEADEGCANTVRLGPFAGPVEAAAALDTARQRSEEWDSDPSWNEESDQD